ncbi:MAG TPA: hypothetical protein VHD36_24665 [Pirellulales bacterium]|nr:hypothetical protein [Pirellulales bacterium]
MDYDVQRFTRHCAASGRELAPGEEFFTALVAEGAEVRRLDFAIDAWTGPPERSLGWWKSRVPTPDAKRPRLAPNDVLLELFTGLEGIEEKADMRLVMALLLVRRRVLRLEKQETDERGRETLVLFSPREDATYRVAAVMPEAARAQEIQDELSRLLYAGSE